MAEPAYLLPDATPESWPEQGRWTWEDYLRLPEDGRRYEIIRGRLYVSPAPFYRHQYAVSRLFMALGRFVEEHRLGIVLTAPIDVILPEVASPVQPDLVYLPSDRMPAEDARNVVGPPALVAEVLSPSTRRIDRRVKLEAYEAAGVAEYWLVDPESRTVTVHALDAERGRYRRRGRYGVGDEARSALLDGFAIAVATLFP